MKWVLSSSRKALLQEFHLVHNGECEVILKYNPIHHSARISYGDIHRLFFLESTGTSNGKIVFKNEYGMETGMLSFDRWHNNQGTIVIDKKKYHYEIQKNPQSELIIFENNAVFPMVKVENPDGNISPIDHNCLLFGLCWYLFLNIKNRNSVEHAA